MQSKSMLRYCYICDFFSNIVFKIKHPHCTTFIDATLYEPLKALLNKINNKLGLTSNWHISTKGSVSLEQTVIGYVLCP